ncbi:disease resistance protein RPM1 [Cannabis sativa]|uniref:disease resistance protein RPM1 n=1 Tax=Cannabis sativa TaxID=3483 RepID=UPI0029CA2609|nr:disease resistance protein RPM1 [Cannabis sativa]
MKYALPGNDNGSRVIITTRNEVVAPCDFVQKLETWSHDMAYELFSKKILGRDFKCLCPEELEKLSHKIIQKCQGLPLAIRAIAGLLSRKNVQSEWQKVLDNIDFEFKTNSQLTRIFQILSLSYHDLPYHLKPCFLYFGIFPEDYLIEKNKLCRLWISEGFVQARESKTAEEEAEGYINELVERSLVCFEILHGTVKGCKVHDLMHEFIISKVNDLCFCQILSQKNSEFDENKHRRLSICGSIPATVGNIVNILTKYISVLVCVSWKESHMGYEPSLTRYRSSFILLAVYSTATITNKIQQFTGVRSILLLNINGIELIDKSFWIALFKSSKLLKVLDFENAPLDYLPKEVGNLFQLRYLNLKDTNIKVLPESICNLHDLQYLNLENTQVDKLPKSIGKLRNLRFLNILYAFVWELPLEINKLCNLRQVFASRKEDTQANLSAVKIQEGFSYLENLEILMHVEVHQDVIGFINELKNLSNLKMLGVSNLTKETSRAICDVSKRLNHLHTLILSVGDVDEILDLEPISSSPPPLLHTLYLSGQLNKFPHCLLDFNNLMMLALRLSKLTQNPLKYLKDLPNLICLLLIDNSYEGEQLHFEEGSFPKLNEIRFRNLPELKFMKIDKGALPLLKVLIIESCPLIEEVPSGIQYLTKLKKLCIWNMPKPFVDRVLSNEGTDYSKIQHIPIVDII